MLLTTQVEWDADDTDCQGKTQIKTDFLNTFSVLFMFVNIIQIFII